MARNGFVPVESQGQDEERDDDLSFDDDDGVFDSADDIFDEQEGGDSDGEGIFADNTSIFSAPQEPSVDHSNAITTREMEKRRYEDPKPHESMKAARKVYNKRAGFKPAPKPKRVLVAKFDDQGRPIVAHFAGGKQLEPFRVPTEKEFISLKTKGRIVKGGVGPIGQTEPTTVGTGIPWKKILIGGAVIVAGGGAAWYLWRRRKNALENTVVQNVPEAAAAGLDDEDDVESED